MTNATQPIREIVAAQTSAAAILQRFDIDVYSHADELLADACAQLQISVDQILEKLADAETAEHGTPIPDPAGLSTPRLIQHIVRAHHRRVRRDLPALAAMAESLATSCSNHAPELLRVQSLVEELRNHLSTHIENEELMMFPLIAQMDDEARHGETSIRVSFRAVGQPISKMMEEHDSSRRYFVELGELAKTISPPAWVDGGYSALYAGIRAFEVDFSQHVYLENEVLFPRAIALEAELNRRR